MSKDTGNYRDEMLNEFSVDEHGRIVSPGKFEGEMIYVPYFWQQGLDGCADDDDGETFSFEIGDDERQQFPELGDAKRIALSESESGFVFARIY